MFFFFCRTIGMDVKSVVFVFTFFCVSLKYTTGADENKIGKICISIINLNETPNLRLYFDIPFSEI